MMFFSLTRIVGNIMLLGTNQVDENLRTKASRRKIVWRKRVEIWPIFIKQEQQIECFYFVPFGRTTVHQNSLHKNVLLFFICRSIFLTTIHNSRKIKALRLLPLVVVKIFLQLLSQEMFWTWTFWHKDSQLFFAVFVFTRPSFAINLKPLNRIYFVQQKRVKSFFFFARKQAVGFFCKKRKKKYS